MFVNVQQQRCKLCKTCKILPNFKFSVEESCRFQKNMKNAHLIARIGYDTAENEQHFADILTSFVTWLGAWPGRRAPPRVSSWGAAKAWCVGSLAFWKPMYYGPSGAREIPSLMPTKLRHLQT